MTKKDFALIAGVIFEASCVAPGDLKAIETVTSYFVSRLGNENPRFDPNKLVKACETGIGAR